MFEKATRMKLRIATGKGNLSVEDLWDLNLAQLNEVAKGLNRRVKELGEEDFLKVEKKEETVTRFSFDIVLHILNTKKKEAEEAVSLKAKKEERQKLLDALAAKKEAGIANLSEEEIKAKLAELDA